MHVYFKKSSFEWKKMNQVQDSEEEEQQKKCIEEWLARKIKSIDLFPLFCDTVDDDVKISKMTVLSVNKDNVSDASLNTLKWQIQKNDQIATVRIFIENEAPLRWNVYMWCI
jgi:hypothetical protein